MVRRLAAVPGAGCWAATVKDGSNALGPSGSTALARSPRRWSALRADGICMSRKSGTCTTDGWSIDMTHSANDSTSDPSGSPAQLAF
jgi:hypothetical protein